MWQRILSSLLLSLCGLGFVAAGSGPDQGSLNGKVAVAFWAFAGLPNGSPNGLPKKLGPQDLLAPNGMEVRMVPEGDLDQELAFPCGQWLAPRPGKYKYWLEGNGWISPSSAVLNYADLAGEGRATVREVVAAGTIALTPEIQPADSVSLRLLHLSSHNRGLGPRSEMSRRVSGKARHEGVLMPAGPVLASLFDREQQEYRALARPVEVPAGGRITVSPQPPARAVTDLVVILDFPLRIANFADHDVQLTVAAPEQSARSPEVVVKTADRVYAVWYGLLERRVTLAVNSPTVFLPPQDLALRSGKIESYYGQLRSRPDLEVELRLPSGFTPSSDAHLQIHGENDLALVADQPLIPGNLRYLFRDLLPQPLRITFDTPPWFFTERVDLSDGMDSKLAFAPPSYRVWGTVERGGQPTAATVTFQIPRGERYQLHVPTEENGFYETLLFRSGNYVALVRPVDGPEAPYVDFRAESVETNLEWNFHLPDNRWTVRVQDVVTGAGIPDARVAVGSRAVERGQRSTQSTRTDAAGLARLPPLDWGQVELWAEAEGYLRSGVTEIELSSTQKEGTITLTLEPQGEKRGLRCRLPDGTAASHTKALLVADLRQPIPLWESESDGEGRLAVPARFAQGWLLLRHPQSAFLVRRWSSAEASRRDWILPAPAPALSVQVVRGGDPAVSAHLQLWLDEQPLAGPLLYWLTASRPVDGEGRWVAHHLPQKPLRLLAAASGEEMAPLSELQARAIDFPWPSLVVLEISD